MGINNNNILHVRDSHKMLFLSSRRGLYKRGLYKVFKKAKIRGDAHNVFMFETCVTVIFLQLRY